jgi:methionyl-tRNA synthetase
MTDKTISGLTTPLYYVNARPHMGHLYTTLVTDTLARWHRVMGNEVLFITGSDEHGQKVLESAEKLGKKPIEWADEIVDYTKVLWEEYNVAYDRFVRTTEEQHYTDVQNFFKKVLDNGYIYKGQYEGPYCVPCETFWTEGQLIEGNCPECARPTKLMAEDSYFFKLSAFQK